VVSARAAHPTPALVCRLYSEDSADAKRDFGALEQIVRGMLLLVEEHARARRIDFKPIAGRVSGPCWKSARSKEVGTRQKRTTLLQNIATELVRGHVVFFHVDGDCIWKEHKRAPVRGELERFRRDLRAVAAHAQIGSLDESILDDAFIAVVPFYSIESWLYACTEQLCLRTSDAKELERIAEWAADLRKLDEVPKIKRELSIQDRCNHELAPHIPAAALCAAGKSYADTVERVRKSARVQAGLAETLRRDW
jgi:hypothetical protein